MDRSNALRSRRWTSPFAALLALAMAVLPLAGTVPAALSLGQATGLTAAHHAVVAMAVHAHAAANSDDGRHDHASVHDHAGSRSHAGGHGLAAATVPASVEGDGLGALAADGSCCGTAVCHFFCLGTGPRLAGRAPPRIVRAALIADPQVSGRPASRLDRPPRTA